MHDLDHEATRLGGKFGGLVDALVLLGQFSKGMPRGAARDALDAFRDQLDAKADQAREELRTATERLAKSFRTQS